MKPTSEKTGLNFQADSLVLGLSRQAGRTPLHIAALKDRESSVNELIAAKANIEAKDEVAGTHGHETFRNQWVLGIAVHLKLNSDSFD